jgi:hypothetical protein
MSIVYSLPIIVVAFLIGNRVHNLVPNEKFMDWVYIVQLISGLIAIAAGIGAILA